VLFRKGGLTIVDYHAAHERVLLRSCSKGWRPSRDSSFSPAGEGLGKDIVSLSLIETCSDFGIEIAIRRKHGHGQAVPQKWKMPISRNSLGHAAGFLRNMHHRTLRMILLHGLHATVLFGQEILSPTSFRSSLKTLQRQTIRSMPHGRPTRIFYSLHDLNKLFSVRETRNSLSLRYPFLLPLPRGAEGSGNEERYRPPRATVLERQAHPSCLPKS